VIRFHPATEEKGIMSKAFTDAFRRIFKEELEEERKAGQKEGRQERSEEIYGRMIAANIPEEQARAIAFG
jgi:hypothetical protein